MRQALDDPTKLLFRKKSVPRPVSPGAISCTLPDAAAACGLSIATLPRHQRAGRLRFFKVGGRTLVDAASLRALITNSSN